MASQAGATQSHPELTLSLDYGTSVLAASWSIAHKAADGTWQSTPPIPFNFTPDSNVFESPQELAYDAQGRFIWGHEVAAAYLRGDIEAEDIISHLKLCLCEDHKTSDFVRQINEQLRRRNKTVDNVLKEHLAGIGSKVLQVLQHSPLLFKYSATDIASIKTNLFLSVPQMWKIPAHRRIVQAGKAAGFSQVELFFEPQSAAAFILDNLLQLPTLPAHIHQGSSVLVSDTGGGTSDFWVGEFVDDPSRGALVTMRQVGEALGTLSGSQMINLKCLAWLKNEACQLKGKSFAQICKELGRSEVDVCRQALTEFEHIKVKFVRGSVRPSSFNIDPVDEDAADSWTVKMSSQRMENIILAVIRENLDHIDSQLRLYPSITTIAVTGGLGRSTLFDAEIRTRFGGQYTIIGVGNTQYAGPNNISQGSMQRYKGIDTSGLRSTVTFGISQEEKWNERRHPDATKGGGAKWRGGKTLNPTYAFRHGKPAELNENLGYIDEDTKVPYVYDRFIPFSQQGDSEIWQLDYVGERQLFLERKIYWTEAQYDAGAPMLLPCRNNSDKLRKNPDFEEWGTLKMERPDWNADDWEPRLLTRRRIPKKLEEDEDGTYNPKAQKEKQKKKNRSKVSEDEVMGGMDEEEPELETIEVYEVYSKITVEQDGANVYFNWYVAKPGTHPFDQNGRPLAGNAPVEQLYQNGQVLQLIEADFNANPSD